MTAVRAPADRRFRRAHVKPGRKRGQIAAVLRPALKVLVLGAGNKAEYRPVELGPMIDGLRVVARGLRSGETIIVKGLVRPGMEVTPQIVSMVATAGKTDLAAKLPEKRDELHKKLAAWRKAVDAQLPTPNPDYDEEKNKTPPKKKKG